MRLTLDLFGLQVRARRLGRQSVPALVAVLLFAGCGSDEVILPGERIAVRPPSVALNETEATGVRPLALPPQRINSRWTHRNGAASGRLVHPALAAAPRIAWTSDIGAGSTRRSRLLTGPVVGAGLVFAMDAAGRLSALTLRGGNVWSRSLVPEGQRPDSGPGGGLALVGGRLFVTTGFGEVLALDAATGTIVWRRSLGAPARAAPVVADGRVIVVLRDDTAYGMEAATGRTLWRVQAAEGGAGLLGGASPAADGSLAVVPFSSGEVLGLLARNGIRVWGAAVTGGRRGLVRNRINDITGDPVIDGNTVYASSQSGRTVALDRDSGARLWTLPEGAYGPAWPAGGSLFLLSDEATLVRADAASGNVAWSIQLPQYVDPRKRRAAIAYYGPVLAGGRLWVAGGDGVLRAFAPVDARPLGAVTLPAGAAAAPVVAGGVMYVVTDDGAISALQ